MLHHGGHLLIGMLAAGTSKEKAKMRAKLQSDVKLVDAAVKVYNDVVPFGTTERAASLTGRDILCEEPVFPWAAEVPAGARPSQPLARCIDSIYSNVILPTGFILPPLCLHQDRQNCCLRASVCVHSGRDRGRAAPLWHAQMHPTL